jgi:hypothetical protein
MKAFIVSILVASSIACIAAPQAFAAAKHRSAEQCVAALQVAAKFQGRYQRNVHTGCVALTSVTTTPSERMARPGATLGYGTVR